LRTTSGSALRIEPYVLRDYEVVSEPLSIEDVKVGCVLQDLYGRQYKVTAVGEEPDYPYATKLVRVVHMCELGAEPRWSKPYRAEAVRNFRIVSAPPAPIESTPEPKESTVNQIPIHTELPASRLTVSVPHEVINAVVHRELDTFSFDGPTTFDEVATDALERDLSVLFDVAGASRRHREVGDVTQDALAVRAGVTAQFVSMVENGYLERLVRYLVENK